MGYRRVAATLALCALEAGCSSSSSPGGGGNADSGGGGGGGAPNRVTGTCDQLVQDYLSIETAGAGGTLETGWGSVPSVLQVVPPGGSFCGTATFADGGGVPTTLIVSDLWDQQISSFYAPLVQQIASGCTLQPVDTMIGSPLQESAAPFACTSTGAGGTIIADGSYTLIRITYQP
jgi:hypothetical protein